MTETIRSLVLSGLLALATGSGPAAAGPIGQDDKVALQMALLEYVDANLMGDRFFYFDPVSETAVGLYPANLHPMIVPNGEIVFLCADFRDADGGKVDVDFVARKHEGRFLVFQTLVNNRDVVRRAMKRSEK